MTLKEKTILGIVWSFVEQFGSKFIGLFIAIGLARMLAPAEFGLIAMLSVFISISTSLADSGLSSSLIRSTDTTQRDFSTVFFFSLLGSVVLYLVLFFTAPFIAEFYKQELLTSIIRIYCLSIVVNAFFSVQNARLTKEMNFKAQTIIKLPSVIGGGMVGFVLAKMGYGVWSLVWMNLMSSIISALAYWIYSDWRPGFIFDKESFKRHFNFGYKMTLSGVLENLFQSIYTIIIGKYYSATQLGFYSRADSMSLFPASTLSVALGRVTYPMFSHITHDNERLKAVYKRILQQVLFWNAPVLILLCVTAEPVFRLVLTEKWLPAVPYFQILCISGIMYPLHAYNLNILKVKGRSDLVLKIEFMKKILFIIGIILVIPYGIYGLLYWQLVSNFLFYFLNSAFSGRAINYTVKEQLTDIFPTLALSSLTGFICRFTDLFLMKYYEARDLDRIIIISLLFAIIYLTFSNIIKLTAIADFKHLILKK